MVQYDPYPDFCTFICICDAVVVVINSLSFISIDWQGIWC